MRRIDIAVRGATASAVVFWGGALTGLFVPVHGMHVILGAAVMWSVIGAQCWLSRGVRDGQARAQQREELLLATIADATRPAVAPRDTGPLRAVR